MIKISQFDEQDWGATWQIIEPVFRSGEPYPFPPEITEKEAYKVWIEKPSVTFVATDENNRVMGTCYIKPNQPALGAHVCNCEYIAGVNARGRGVAQKCVNIRSERR